MRPSVFRSFFSAILFMALAAPLLPLHAQTQPAPGPAQSAPDTAKPQQFFLRLVPPRPTFATDMTSQEQAIMQQHAQYWTDQFKTGKVLIIGPVLDPRGAFGMAVLECTGAEAHTMADNDPSVKAGIIKIDVLPMRVFLRK